ncbi:peptide ABC transporter substrate-binding protein [Anaeropeptidivorans aminofermentans]|jgi:oligopeptide transport system substrate-binding protein|uniref:peptide ABC transporter substrate-binding protein n=1 Tax=Anaeropeptidivorans aminofermentans TaxID=2934315 RepID=UPI00202500D7|nr:ABC transporter substrate-binding protein [Anaeropeptidivorans aminofermentans]
MKKLTAILMAGIMGLAVFTGCGGNGSSNDGNQNAQKSQETATAEAPKEEAKASEPASSEPYGTFNNYFTGDIDTINPHIYTLSNSGDVFALVSLMLYKQMPTEDGKAFAYVGELAEGEPIKMDEEGKIWNIKIRENAVWENGDKIDIDDVIYSWKMCLDPILVNSRASQLASDYITIVNATDYYLQGSENKVAWEDVGIKKVDDYTLSLELTDPVTEADIKAHFNYVWTSLVHEPTYEAGMDAGRTKTTYGSSADRFMSCGRFILKDWVNGSQVNMVRNPDYVDKDEIKIAGYSYKMLDDANTALELFLSGDLDVVNLNASVIEQYIDDPRVKIAPATSIQTLTINHGNTNNSGILGNVNFRKALSYAVDRENIAKMTNGIAANYLVPQKCLGDTDKGLTFRQMPEAQEYLEPNLGFDAAKAKEYYDKAMAEAGLTNLTLTLMYNESSANNKSASEFLHKELPKIFGDSFTLELMAAPSSVLNTYIKGWKEGDPNSFELQWRGWNTSTAAPWNGLKVYSSMYSNKNEPYYNDEFDALWEEANYSLDAKLDPAYRLQLTREMEKIALDEVAACPVYEAPGYYMISERVNLISDGYIPGYGFGYSLATISQ